MAPWTNRIFSYWSSFLQFWFLCSPIISDFSRCYSFLLGPTTFLLFYAFSILVHCLLSVIFYAFTKFFIFVHICVMCYVLRRLNILHYCSWCVKCYVLRRLKILHYPSWCVMCYVLCRLKAVHYRSWYVSKSILLIHARVFRSSLNIPQHSSQCPHPIHTLPYTRISPLHIFITFLFRPSQQSHVLHVLQVVLPPSGPTTG